MRSIPAVFHVISEVGIVFFSNLLHGIPDLLAPARPVFVWIGETFVSAAA